MEQVQADRKASLKSRVQKLGSTLSSMVMPNIGALIAWGVLTALFIPDGYLPNESFCFNGRSDADLSNTDTDWIHGRESNCWRSGRSCWGNRYNGGHCGNRHPNAF